MTTETITRARYMSGEVTFHDYYGALVELLGEDALRRLLPTARDGRPLASSQWRELVAADEYLNNVALHQWDAKDRHVRSLVVRAGIDAVAAITGSRGWSLSDSVCVLKETARRYGRFAVTS